MGVATTATGPPARIHSDNNNMNSNENNNNHLATEAHSSVAEIMSLSFQIHSHALSTGDALHAVCTILMCAGSAMQRNPRRDFVDGCHLPGKCHRRC